MRIHRNHYWLVFAALLAIGLATTMHSRWLFEEELAIVETVDSIMVEECHEEFGIDLQGMHIEKGKVRPNQFLAELLLPYNVTYPEITRLVERAKPVFDIRNIRSGADYTILCSADSVLRAEYFIYELSAIDYIVFDLSDSMRVSKASKPVTLEERTASGVISSSLYQTLMDQNLSPALAMELSEIYAWSIDFYRIQKGDGFKLIYDVKKVEDQEVGVASIKASIFTHFSEPYYAFRFQQGEQFDYFDEQGNSLRKAFLQAPLKFSRISSGYTMKRFHPVQKRWKAHLGTDYAAPRGTPIMAVGDGVVTEARYSKFNGNYVKIKHNGTYTTQYLHMSKRASGMKPGTRVRQGETIGYVGSTGLATGPHVCFRFWKNGKQVDHRREKLPPSEPIKPAYKDAYQAHLQDWKQRLEAVGISSSPEIAKAQLP